MAVYDGKKIKQEKDRLDNFNELKNGISSLDKNKELNKYFLAYIHIIDMEKELDDNKKELDRYRNFFSIMKMLIP